MKSLINFCIAFTGGYLTCGAIIEHNTTQRGTTVSYQVQDTAGSTIVGFADVRIAADVSQARWQAEITKSLTEMKKAKGEPLPVGSVVIVSVFPTPWKSEAR